MTACSKWLLLHRRSPVSRDEDKAAVRFLAGGPSTSSRRIHAVRTTSILGGLHHEYSLPSDLVIADYRHPWCPPVKTREITDPRTQTCAAQAPRRGCWYCASRYQVEREKRQNRNNHTRTDDRDSFLPARNVAIPLCIERK